MFRYLILVTMVLYSGTCSYAQKNINIIEILNIEQDIVSLENRIKDLTKKNPAMANIQGLRQFHVFWLGIDDIKKKEYENRSFLYRLYHAYYDIGSNFRKKKKYIRTTTLITDSVGNLVAIGDARLVHVAPVFGKNDIELAKMFFDKKIDFAFYMGVTYITFDTYCVIKDNKISIIKDTKECLEIYSWEEFIDCCFDELVHQKKSKNKIR